VERGIFREDIYYRLWCTVLEVPPLRARREDIPLLVDYFRLVANRGDGLGLDIHGVSREAMAVLEDEEWPGNVRELEAVVKRAMVRRQTGWVTPKDIALPRLDGSGLPSACQILVLSSRQCRRRPCAWLHVAGWSGDEIWWNDPAYRGNQHGERSLIWREQGSCDE
jgi:DNA-binding NtrC family response regulator